MAPPNFGVNVIGYITGNLGLGVAARNTIASLVHCGVPTAGVDVRLPDDRSGADTTWSHLCVRDATSLPHPVNIVHINPVDAAGVWAAYPHFFENRFNIIVPFWELSHIPHSWPALLADYNLILAPSNHILAAISNVSSVPARLYPMGIAKPTPAIGDAHAQFGIAQDRFVFATSFDTDSGLSRKNAVGTIRAFDLAFEGVPDVQLVVKVNGKTRSPELNTLFDRMQPSMRYRIITDYLAHAQLMSVFNACDAYVSLHRAEGLGLGMMESMALGKPVIGTGWSGNMDFMDETNSCPVRFKLTPVVDRHPEYSPLRVGELGHWAEPDLLHAVTLMRRVRSDVSYRERICAEARHSIEERNRSFFGGRQIKGILESYLAYVWERGDADTGAQRTA